MSHLNRFDEIEEENQESLETLIGKITLSIGDFAPTLVVCNYTQLRTDILNKLKTQLEEQDLNIQELELTKDSHKLFDTIESSTQQEVPSFLSIFGFEYIEHLDSFCEDMNVFRNGFQEHFKFPLIFWLSDKTLVKFKKVAPDFYNWLGIPLTFKLSPNELREFIEKISDALFDSTLTRGSDSILNGSTFEQEFNNSPYTLQEAISAYKDLTQEQQSLTPELDANVKFLSGQNYYDNDRLDKAIDEYQSSLKFWQEENKERQGILLFCLSLCYKRKAELERVESKQYWQKEKEFLENCLKAFKETNRLDLVANFVNALEDVLLRLVQDYGSKKQEQISEEQRQILTALLEQLKKVASEAKELHEQYPDPNRLAQDYGFLAAYKLEKIDSLKIDSLEKTNQSTNIQDLAKEAKSYACQALKYIALAFSAGQREYESWYCLLLAKAYIKLSKINKAFLWLWRAKKKSKPQHDIVLHIDILRTLQELYYDEKQYYEAFLERQERQKIEGQYGFRAFIGAVSLEADLGSVADGQKVAQAIKVSLRHNDVDLLMERVRRDDTQLTIVHGPSGVGKSSLIRAGLIPALQEETFMPGGQTVVPVSLRNYQSWVKDIGVLLKEKLKSIQEPLNLSEPLDSVENILEQLNENTERGLRVVLIFDQFEEFFFSFIGAGDRKEFFDFLLRCYKLPFVYIILSLREDYLHLLLEGERLVKQLKTDRPFGEDILSSRVRHELRNFNKKDAKSVIFKLIEGSQLKLDSQLVEERFVRDLAKDNAGEVRPIELQIVGYQLQEQGILTVEAYDNLGEKPKEILINNYLQGIVDSCGKKGDKDDDNIKLANAVLYLLTDEKTKRPPKSRKELTKDLENLQRATKTLKLVLKIFVASGLVKLLSVDRYQLGHDYLATLIRSLRESEYKALRDEAEEARNKEIEATNLAQKKEEENAELSKVNAELIQEKIERERAEGNLQKVKKDLTELKEKEKVSVNNTKKATVLGIIVTVITVIVGIQSKFDYEKTKLGRDLMRLQKDLDALERRQLTSINEPLTNAIKLSQSLKPFPFNIFNIDIIKYIEDFKENKTSLRDSFNKIQQIINTKNPNNDFFVPFKENISAFQLNPNGKSLAVVLDSGKIAVWNIKDDKEKVVIINSDVGKASNLWFSPDGTKMIVFSDKDKTKINLCDFSANDLLNQGKKKRCDDISQIADKVAKNGEKISPLGIRLSPDNNTLVFSYEIISDKDKKNVTYSLWNVQDVKNPSIIKQDSYEPKPSRIADATIVGEKDNQLLVVADRDGNITKWNLKTKQKDSSENSQNNNKINKDINNKTKDTNTDKNEKKTESVGFCSNGESLLRLENSTDSTSTVRVSNLKGDDVINMDRPYSAESISCGGQKGNQVLVRFKDKSLVLLDCKDKGCNKQNNWTDKNFSDKFFSEHVINFKNQNKDDPIRSLQFHQNLDKTINMLAIGSDKGKIRVLKRVLNNDKTLIKNYQLSSSASIWTFNFSEDGKYLAAGSADGTVLIWDLNNNNPIKWKAHNQDILSVSFSKDSQYLATGSTDNTVRVWDWKKSNNEKTYPPLKHSAFVRSVSFNPIPTGKNKQQLATATDDGVIKLWDIDIKDQSFKEKPTSIPPVTGKVVGMNFSPNGQTIAALLDYQTVSVWDLKGNVMLQYDQSDNDRLMNISFTTDDKRLAIIDLSGKVIWQSIEDLDELARKACKKAKNYHNLVKIIPNDDAQKEQKKALEICDKLNLNKSQK